MSDENKNDKGTGGGTGNPDQGAGKESGGKSENERAGWTEKEWLSEIDRRVNDAVKARDAKLKEQLAAKDQDASTQLAELRKSLEEAESRSNFVTAAMAAGLKDIDAGYAVARSLGFIKEGKPDLEAMKKAHPLLFGNASVDTKAGAGNETDKPPLNINQALRAALKRG